MAERFEDVLRRRATHGTVYLAKNDADRLADLVAAVRARRARHPNEARPARAAKCICDACEDEERALVALDEGAGG